MKKILVFILACLSSTVMFAQSELDLHYTIVPQGVGSMYTKLNGVLVIDGVEQANPNLEIGVFDQDGICRGAKLPVVFPRTGQYVYLLQIRGNEGFTYTFRVFDHAAGEEGEELDLIDEVVDDDGNQIVYQGNYIYQHNGTNTSAANPIPLNFSTGGTTQTFTLDITGYGTSTKGGYYLIASPIVEEIAPSEENGFFTPDFDLYFFDHSSVGQEWQNYELNEFLLTNGKGYLYASQANTTLTFTGTPYTGDGILELDYNPDVPNFGGWNLIGNPYPRTASIDREDFYILNGDGDEVIEGSGEIPAMAGIFVIAEDNGETVTFTPGGSVKSNPNLALNLSQGRSVIDRAVIRFSESRRLPKFQINPNHTKIYMPVEGNDYAVVSADDEGEMPVNFKAETNGTYTLTLSTEDAEFNYLHLIDNLTGNDIDLLDTPSYTFNATTTDYASRFRLLFSTSTNSLGEEFGFVSNGNLMVLGIEGEAALQVVDVTGRVLSSESFSGSYNKPINASAGVYMIRLIQGNDMRTQKIVVK